MVNKDWALVNAALCIYCACHEYTENNYVKLFLSIVLFIFSICAYYSSKKDDK